jgi:uncharacterized protein YcbX
VVTVVRISVAPVKSLALLHPDEVRLERHGVLENRRFHLVDDGGRLANLKRMPRLLRVGARWDAAANRLELRFPDDGSAVDGGVELGEAITTEFYGRPVAGRVVAGPWSEALSAYAGRPIRLVQVDEPGAGVDRGRGEVSLVSTGSLAELARHAGVDAVDGRRFRMLFDVDGLAAHEEDAWVRRDLRVGEAVVRVRGKVARCAVTTRHPATAARDLDTLGVLERYRGLGAETGGFDFGVFGRVVEPGLVRVGDAVEPL